MELIQRDEIPQNFLPGRVVQNAVGKNSKIESKKMTVSICRYSAESGPMEPHNHAEETVMVIGCDRAFVKTGPSKDNLCSRYELKVGTIMHFEDLEWHVFGYEEGGYLDAVCIYGQVDRIRPEEMTDR